MSSTVPPIPDKLAMDGIAWRWMTPEDRNFVVGSWFDSAMPGFLVGPGCPFKGLAETVHTARVADNTRLLHRIYCAEQTLLIQRSLEANTPLVVYDLDEPLYGLMGWGSPDYSYVKLMWRGMGIGQALKAACGR